MVELAPMQVISHPLIVWNLLKIYFEILNMFNPFKKIYILYELLSNIKRTILKWINHNFYIF